MWDWFEGLLEDSCSSRSTLYRLTALTVVIAFGTGYVFPKALWVMLILATGIILSMWSEFWANPLYQMVDFPERDKEKTGIAAKIIRFRLALFGGVTTLLAFYLVWTLMGRSISSHEGLLILVAMAVLVGVGVFSRYICAWLTGPFGFAIGNPLDAAKTWIGITYSDNGARKAAFQRIYDLENRVYVLIAGYRTDCTFGSSIGHIKDDLP